MTPCSCFCFPIHTLCVRSIYTYTPTHTSSSSAKVSVLFTLGASISWIMTTTESLGDRLICDGRSLNQSTHRLPTAGLTARLYVYLLSAWIRSGVALVTGCIGRTISALYFFLCDISRLTLGKLARVRRIMIRLKLTRFWHD